MGLLDQVIGGVLGQVLGGGRGGGQQGGGMGGGGMGGGGMGGGMGGAMSPIVQALLMLLMSKGASGGLGDIFGGGQGPRSEPGRRPEGGPDTYGGREDDLGGFGQDRRDGGQGRSGGGYGDLAGMLDGPGGSPAGASGHDGGAGPYARLDRDQADEQGGLDGLIDRFQRGGFGDVMDSWVGPGQNRQIPPNQLADALGHDTVDNLQSRTGLDRNDLLSQLAQALPGVIDGLTPQGRRPNADERRGW